MIQYYVINKKNIYTEKQKIKEFILKIDKLFPAPLSKKVNINEYCGKILNKGIVIVAKNIDNQIVGILTGYANDEINKLAYISILCTLPEYQNQHIGTHLLNIFTNIVKENGIKKIFLHTHKENENAISFYKKNNFMIDRIIKPNYNYSITLSKEINKNINILLTSVGRRGYLVKYFKEALGDDGKVYVSNSSDISPAFNHADGSIVTPLIYDEGYIDFLLAYCKEKNVNAIISLFDIDLPVLSKNKNRFKEQGIDIIVSNPEIIEICNDKWKTYQFLKENNLNTVHTYIKLKEVKQALNNNEIKYPVIVKPRWGMGSISVMEAENEEELNILYKMAINKIKNTYLKYESISNLEESVLIQEKINGREYGLDIINDLKGNYQTTIVKEKYAMRAGETDCAKVVNNAALREVGEKIGKKLCHIGNMDMDVFLVGNKPYILEMNARFGGGYPFSHMAGVNLPKAIIAWLNNEKVDRNILEPQRLDVLFHKDINIVELIGKS